MGIHKKFIISTVVIIISSSVVLHTAAVSNSDQHLTDQQSLITESTYNTPFIDLNNFDWAITEINELVNKGYIEGYGDGTFRPNQYATRAEAVSVIARSLEIPLDSTFQLKAKDISSSHPYYKEIRKLAELGIIQNSEYFRPEEPLTRAQIAKMLALAYKVEVDEVNKISFVDCPKSFWAKNYIESLADVEIIKGKTENIFSPNSYVTRAQLSVLVSRGIDFQQKVESYQLAYDYLSKDYIPTINTYEEWTNEVIELVNEERKKAGVQPLVQDSALNQLAIIKAQDMIRWEYFDHYSPYYGHPWDMATLFDYEFTRFGENIARNFHHPKDVVEAWMASESHRENILRANYTHIGICVKSDDKGNNYWVQLFSSK